MIDWFNVAANSLWIISLALALATVSYASWEASLAHEKLRLYLNKPKYQLTLNLAGVLFCLGLAATSDRVWKMILWIILAILFLIQSVAEGFSRKAKS